MLIWKKIHAVLPFNLAKTRCFAKQQWSFLTFGAAFAWEKTYNVLKYSYVGSSLCFEAEPLCILHSSLNHCCVTSWTTTPYFAILMSELRLNRGCIPALVPESIPLVVWLDGKGPDCPHFPSLHHPDKLPTHHLELSMWYKCDAISHHWSGKAA